MARLVKGVHQFQEHVFCAQRELFARLAQQQAPGALFITCSDSRISPNLLTQTGPGDLFVLRNAGNIAPPYGVQGGGEAATVEYAVAALGVRDIIVCGHTNCGAMKALIGDLGQLADDMPLVGAWLGHAAATRRIVREKYQHLSPEQRWVAAVEENVLVQLENLRTHPAVAAKLARGELNLHGWVYSLETGGVYAFRPEEGEFMPLAESRITLRALPSKP
jgi:carbonic anhydrase